MWKRNTGLNFIIIADSSQFNLQMFWFSVASNVVKVTFTTKHTIIVFKPDLVQSI